MKSEKNVASVLHDLRALIAFICTGGRTKETCSQIFVKLRPIIRELIVYAKQEKLQFELCD